MSFGTNGKRMYLPQEMVLHFTKVECCIIRVEIVDEENPRLARYTVEFPDGTRLENEAGYMLKAKS